MQKSRTALQAQLLVAALLAACGTDNNSTAGNQAQDNAAVAQDPSALQAAPATGKADSSNHSGVPHPQSTEHLQTFEVEITEWLVPYENSRPRDPYVDSQGRVWFCGQGGAYLAYLVPGLSEFAKFDLADGAKPHNLIIDDDDSVWFAANTLPYIGKLDPESGKVKKFAMPAAVSDPHTLVFDSKGDIWFTAQRANYIGKLDTQTGKVTPVAVPIENARPYGIKIDSSDRPWIVLFGTNKLASVDPETFAIQTYDLPRTGTRARRLEITDDGMVWYGDYAEGMLGRFSPADESVTEWAMPGGSAARPYGTALDDEQTLWLAEGGMPNTLVSFDTRSEQFTSTTAIPNSGGAIRHMYFHPDSREIWFGEDSNYLGRARLP